jgi:CBS domain-containing protein
MNAHKISCVVLVDGDQHVVGLLTERDVLRRLTLLDVEDKLTRAVGTIATRDVLFADADNLHESIVRLHFEKGLRHFPVRRGQGHHLSDVIGIVTLTDLVRAFLAEETRRVAPTAVSGHATRRLAVICHAPAQLDAYREIFQPAGFEVFRVDDAGQFFKQDPKGLTPLVFDFDGLARTELSGLIAPTKKYPGHLIMAASDPNIVRLFHPYMDHARQTLALKPLDRDYLVWLVTTKWAAHKPAAAAAD